MSVKRSQSAARVLAVLECIARHQPIGVSELARLLQADKSAVQRAVMTLADDGWIRLASGNAEQVAAHRAYPGRGSHGAYAQRFAATRARCTGSIAR